MGYSVGLPGELNAGNGNGTAPGEVPDWILWAGAGLIVAVVVWNYWE